MADSGPKQEPYPELVIGLVGPLGVDIDGVTRCLAGELKRVGYKAKLIRLSDLLPLVEGLETNLEDTPEDKRLETRMNAGTELRSRTGVGGMLARIALLRIRQVRKEVTDSGTKPANSHAYILRQLKHRDEIEDLRDIYGEGFVTLSIYAPRAAREAAARRRLATKMTGRPQEWIQRRAEELIKKDEAEEGKPLGQRVGDAFPRGDFFVDATDRPSLNSSLRRYVELLFGNHFHTPTRDEFGMYQAAAAARRSSDLSRQVGAALVTAEGEVVALGCNDIPKAGGGLYWPGDDPDGRDFAYLGYDPAEQARRDILADILGRLLDAKMLVY